MINDLKLINQGRTAEIYDFGENRILKLFRKDFPPEAINHEYRICEALKDSNLPIPQFFGKMELENRIGLIYEYIKGTSMLQLFLSRPGKFFAYTEKMAEIHHNIHQFQLKGIPRQKEQLEFFINHANLLTDEQKKIIITYLKKLDDGNFLCHGDLHPDNILFTTSGKPAVIDWMTATIGNPAADVVRTKIILKYSKAPAHLPLIVRIITNSVKLLLCNAYLKHYFKITGINPREIKPWELPVAAARLMENGPPEEKKALLKFIKKELRKIVVK